MKKNIIQDKSFQFAVEFTCRRRRNMQNSRKNNNNPKKHIRQIVF